jgi:DnaJ-class molecular chaperone
MTKTKKPPRPSIFTKGYSPYGHYEGEAGSQEEWRAGFDEAWTHTSATEEIREETPWSILGIAPDCTVSEIKSAYRKLMLIHHPDQGGDPAMARKIMASYFLLMEKTK